MTVVVPDNNTHIYRHVDRNKEVEKSPRIQKKKKMDGLFTENKVSESS